MPEYSKGTNKTYAPAPDGNAIALAFPFLRLLSTVSWLWSVLLVLVLMPMLVLGVLPVLNAL